MKVISLDKNASWKDIPIDGFGGVRPEMSVCITRYGGIGDMIMASPLFRAFKKKGYRVVLNTTDRGLEICRHDPSIDEIIFQPTDWVESWDLTEYWGTKIKPLCSRWVNLSQSIEQRLLVFPDRMHKGRYVEGDRLFDAPHEERHRELNRNYVEETHKIAGIEYSNETPRFYPTTAERAWAKAFRSQRRGMMVMWAVAGSSIHKIYPWQDHVIKALLSCTRKLRFVLVGAEFDRILEVGWEKQPRVIKKCGRLSVRKTLALAQQCDAVVGPETGVLNAVSGDSVAKVMLLSHSSKENLTKHWSNTITLEPHDTPCFPCHKMHVTGFRHCNKDEETGVALCAANISPQRVIEAIYRSLSGELRDAA